MPNSSTSTSSPSRGDAAAVTAADAREVHFDDTVAESGVTVIAKPSASFFSFADPGGFVWWAGVILGALAAACLAAIIVIGVESGRRTPPSAVIGFLETQTCPATSHIMPTVAYTGWQPECPVAAPGAPRRCYSDGDCVMMSSRCAPPSLLGLLSCEDVNLPGEGDAARVCVLNLGAHSPTLELPNGGFCTAPGSQCAWCADWWSCNSLASCVPASECAAPPSANGSSTGEGAGAGGSWHCV